MGTKKPVIKSGAKGGSTKAEPPLAVKRSKTGLGLFATRKIAKGERIIEYTGRLISNEEAATTFTRYLFGVNRNWTLDGSVRTNLARYGNHSCRPNAEARLTGRRIWIWAVRTINPGDEITYDYGEEYFNELIAPVGCRCDHCAAKAK